MVRAFLLSTSSSSTADICFGGELYNFQLPLDGKKGRNGKQKMHVLGTFNALQVRSAQDCAARCLGHPDCRGFTFKTTVSVFMKPRANVCFVFAKRGVQNQKRLPKAPPPLLICGHTSSDVAPRKVTRK